MIYPEYPQEGHPLSALWGRRVVDCLKALHLIPGDGIGVEDLGTNGTLVKQVRRKVTGGAGMPFSGTAYVAGRKTTGLGAKAWVRVHLDSATAEDHDGPAPDPFPAEEEWYEVAQTSGDIHARA
jgi:hypothetical protein